MAFIPAREGTTVALRTIQKDRMADVAASVRDTINNYRLVADYFQRPAAVERFLRRIKAYNGAAAASSACNTNNRYFPQWVAVTIQSFWILIGGLMISEGLIRLG